MGLSEYWDKAVSTVSDAIEYTVDGYHHAVAVTTDLFELADKAPDRAALMVGAGVENVVSQVVALPGYALDGSLMLGDWLNRKLGGAANEGYSLVKPGQFGFGAGEAIRSGVQQGIDNLQVMLGATGESALAVPRNEMEAHAKESAEITATVVSMGFAAPRTAGAAVAQVARQETRIMATRTATAAAAKAEGRAAAIEAPAAAATRPAAAETAAGQTVRRQWREYSGASARMGVRNQLYAATNWSADRLAEMGAVGRLAALPLRAAGGVIRWGVPVAGTGMVGVVGADVLTDGESTRSLTRLMNDVAAWTADAVEESMPEAAKLLREMGPDAAKLTLKVMAAPVGTAAHVIDETAKYHGINLPVEQAEALAQMIGGSPLMAALTASGHEVKPEEMITMYQEARESGDPVAYIRQDLQKRFHLTDAQVAEYERQAEEIKTSARQAQEHMEKVGSDLLRLNRISGTRLSDKFNSVVAENHLTMFSSFNMFLATVCDWIGLDKIAEQFKRAVVVDATISQYGDKFELLKDGKRDPAAQYSPAAPEPAGVN